MDKRFSDMLFVKTIDNPFIPSVETFEETVTISKKGKRSNSEAMDTEVNIEPTQYDVVSDGGDYVKVNVNRLKRVVGDVNGSEYKLLMVIMSLVEKYYNYNCAIELSLDIVNNSEFNLGKPFNKKTMYAAINKFLVSNDPSIQPLLVKHKTRRSTYWVNPLIVYRGYKKVLLARYNEEMKKTIDKDSEKA